MQLTAKNLVLDIIDDGKSFMKSKNRRGPKTDPEGAH